MVAGANISTQILKMLVERPHLGVTTETVNSLPSGHVTVAVSLCIALIMVAPEWLRGPSAWLGWVWTCAMGVSVMLSAWHRLADVLVAVLLTGAWALLLTPLESRKRHGVLMQKVMWLLVCVCLVLALFSLVFAVWNVDIVGAAQPGSGFGFADFLSVQPMRANLLALSALLWMVAVVGSVIYSVDRLAGE
nr:MULTISPECIES: phosphatase PAP2 family protein [unclassified Schaalia]